MSEWKRNVKFWSRNLLENLGLIVVISFGIMVFLGLETSPETAGGWRNMAVASLRQYPYYLTLTGGFVMVIASMGYFQTYIPLLVSFNSRRRDTIIGLICSMSGVTVIVGVLSVLIFRFTPAAGDTAGQFWLPLLMGFMFLQEGMALIFGVVVTRWGKIGTIVFTVLIVITAALFGMGVAVGGAGLPLEIINKIGMNPWLGLAAGLVVFAAGAAVSLAATRKLEVRI